VSVHPRMVLGPGVCQGCGETVVYEMQGTRHLGWLHADGAYTCAQRPTKLTKREYNRQWMRRFRAGML